MQGFKSKNSLTERFTNTKLPQNDKNLIFNLQGHVLRLRHLSIGLDVWEHLTIK